MTDPLHERLARQEAERLGALSDHTPVPVPQWIAPGDTKDMPQLVRDMVTWRPGWTPEGWAQRLRQWATRISKPEVAEQFNEAARLLEENKR